MNLQHEVPKNKRNATLNWNNDWFNSYESPWGIFEKLKFTNFIDANDILRLFGVEKVRNLKSFGKTHRQLIHLNGLDEDIVERFLGFSLHQHNNHLLQKLFQCFYNFNKSSSYYFRDDLFFCIDCLKTGYHSLFFQSKLIHFCPFHKLPLIQGCPYCRNPIPYLLSDQYTDGPFLCKCGNGWLTSETTPNPTFSWKKPIADIQSQALNAWLNLDQSQINRLNKCRFFSGIDLEDDSEVLEKLISVVDSDFKISKEYTHHKIETSNYINSLKIDINENELQNENYLLKNSQINDVVDSWTLLNNNAKYQQHYDYIYNNSQKTVKAFARHIRNTIYPEHRTCVKRLVRLLKEENKSFPPICPHAYAYVFWRKSIDEIDHFYEVDRYGHANRKYPYDLDVASGLDRDFIKSFVDEWIDYYDYVRDKELVGLNWIINKIISALLSNHYMNWLRISTKYSEAREEANFRQYIYKDLAFFTVIFPSKDTEEPIEFHWWDKTNKYSTLLCPFPSQSKKRISEKELRQSKLSIPRNFYNKEVDMK